MRVFICYRRGDSQVVAGRVYDWLEREFGSDNIFKDVESIPIGRDFRSVIQEAVARCGVLLALIGDRWVGEAGLEGARFHDPTDYVRIEVETALGRQIPVIPLLVDEGELPRVDQLPESLQALIYRNGMRVRPDPDFRSDMARLVKALHELEGGKSSVPDVRQLPVGSAASGGHPPIAEVHIEAAPAVAGLRPAHLEADQTRPAETSQLEDEVLLVPLGPAHGRRPSAPPAPPAPSSPAGKLLSWLRQPFIIVFLLLFALVPVSCALSRARSDWVSSFSICLSITVLMSYFLFRALGGTPGVCFLLWFVLMLAGGIAIGQASGWCF
jgi:hypothetical protein